MTYAPGPGYPGHHGDPPTNQPSAGDASWAPAAEPIPPWGSPSGPAPTPDPAGSIARPVSSAGYDQQEGPYDPGPYQGGAPDPGPYGGGPYSGASPASGPPSDWPYEPDPHQPSPAQPGPAQPGQGQPTPYPAGPYQHGPHQSGPHQSAPQQSAPQQSVPPQSVPQQQGQYPSGHSAPYQSEPYPAPYPPEQYRSGPPLPTSGPPAAQPASGAPASAAPWQSVSPAGPNWGAGPSRTPAAAPGSPAYPASGSVSGPPAGATPTGQSVRISSTSAPPLPGRGPSAHSSASAHWERYGRIAQTSGILAAVGVVASYVGTYLFPLLGWARGTWQLGLQTNIATTAVLCVLAGSVTYLATIRPGRLPAPVVALVVAVAVTVVLGGLPAWLTTTTSGPVAGAVVLAAIALSTFTASLLGLVRPHPMVAGGFLAASLESALTVVLSLVLGTFVIPALMGGAVLSRSAAIPLGALINYGYGAISVIVSALVATLMMRSAIKGSIGMGVVIGAFPAVVRIIAASFAGLLTAVVATTTDGSAEAFLAVTTGSSVAALIAVLGAGNSAIVILATRNREDDY